MELWQLLALTIVAENKRDEMGLNCCVHLSQRTTTSSTSFFTSLMEESFELECRALADKGSQTDAFHVCLQTDDFIFSKLTCFKNGPLS